MKGFLVVTSIWHGVSDRVQIQDARRGGIVELARKAATLARTEWVAQAAAELSRCAAAQENRYYDVI